MINEENFRKTEGRLYRHYRKLKEIDKLEEELKRTIRQIRKLRAKIREIKKQDPDIEHAIGLLDEIYKQFVLLKYKDDLSFEQISRELHMSSKSTVSDWREKVVIDIAKLLYKNAG